MGFLTIELDFTGTWYAFFFNWTLPILGFCAITLEKTIAENIPQKIMDFIPCNIGYEDNQRGEKFRAS